MTTWQEHRKRADALLSRSMDEDAKADAILRANMASHDWNTNVTWPCARCGVHRDKRKAYESPCGQSKHEGRRKP